jgi:hypothetical protein
MLTDSSQSVSANRNPLLRLSGMSKISRLSGQRFEGSPCTPRHTAMIEPCPHQSFSDEIKRLPLTGPLLHRIYNLT